MTKKEIIKLKGNKYWDSSNIWSDNVYSAYLSSNFSVNTTGEYYQLVPFNVEMKKSRYITKKANGVFDLEKGTYLVLFSLYFTNSNARSDVILYRDNELVGDYHYYSLINGTICGNFLINLTKNTEIKLLIDKSNTNNTIKGENGITKYGSTITFIKLM